MIPKRIQRKRTKGWRMPEGAVYVGRPTKWGNPFSIGQTLQLPGKELTVTRENCLEMFRVHAKTMARLSWWLEPLRSKDLACWCPLNQPCHADILLELANTEPAPEAHSTAG